jgi:hypothetical protein
MTLNGATNGAGQPAAPEIYKKVTDAIYDVLRQREPAGVQSFYYKLLLEFEERRQALGISMERLSEMAGLPDRAYSKMLYPESKSGRLARWPTVQIVCDALFPDGYDLKITAAKGDKIRQYGVKYQLRQIAMHYDRLTRREIMQALGRRGGRQSGAARARRAEERRLRKALARHAARIRWNGSKKPETRGKQSNI